MAIRDGRRSHGGLPRMHAGQMPGAEIYLVVVTRVSWINCILEPTIIQYISISYQNIMAHNLPFKVTFASHAAPFKTS